MTCQSAKISQRYTPTVLVIPCQFRRAVPVNWASWGAKLPCVSCTGYECRCGLLRVACISNPYGFPPTGPTRRYCTPSKRKNHRTTFPNPLHPVSPLSRKQYARLGKIHRTSSSCLGYHPASSKGGSARSEATYVPVDPNSVQQQVATR
jgi:hypothetical protein